MNNINSLTRIKLLAIVVFSFLIFNISFAQVPPAIIWQNTIGGSSYDYCLSVKQAGNGFILAGYSSSDLSGDKTEFSNGYIDYWIVKVDSMGAIEWQNTIGGNENDELMSVVTTNDNGYMLGGYSTSDSTGDKTEYPLSAFAPDYWIVKTDSAGNVLWENTIGGTGSDFLNSILQTSDHGFILAGYSNSGISGDKTENSNGNYDYWIVKTDASGIIEWQNTIGGSAMENIRTIEQTTDGGFIIGGTSNSPLSGDKTEASLGVEDYWIVKLDSTGNIQWQNTIGGSNEDQLYVVRQTSDQGYIIAGSSRSNISGDKTENSNGNMDYWIVKTDSAGAIEWQQTLGGSDMDYCYEVQQTSDGGYILGGSSFSNISGDKTENSKGTFDYWIIKLDGSGNIQWQKTIGGNEYDMVNSVVQLNDGSYLLGGYSKSVISGDKTEACQGEEDYWIVKLDSDASGVNENSFSSDQIEIFPNPSKGIVTLQFQIPESLNYSCGIVNIFGEEVYNSFFNVTPDESVELDLSFLAKGIYLFNFSNEKTSAGKVIVIE